MLKEDFLKLAEEMFGPEVQVQVCHLKAVSETSAESGCLPERVSSNEALASLN